MQILINIPEEEYRCVQITGHIGNKTYISNAIYNGTPLTKGHGRLLDEKEILATEEHEGGWYDLVDMPEYLAGVPAVIEADTESEG